MGAIPIGGVVEGTFTDEIKEALTAGVQSFASTQAAWAALMTDGTVVTWGSSNNGGDSSAVASQLTDIVQISGARCKFTARKSTGKAIMWGGNSGCDSSAQNHFDHFSSNNELDDVVNLAVHELDFAALKADGTARGFGEWGRQTPSLSNVQDVFTTHREGVGAIDGSGNVKTWGRGGTTLSGVQSVYSNWFSYTFFAYRKTDGTVTSTWSAPSSPPTDVQDVKMTGNAVAALKTDGTVQVWGNSDWGEMAAEYL